MGFVARMKEKKMHRGGFFWGGGLNGRNHLEDLVLEM